MLWQDFGTPLRAAPGGSCPLATPLPWLYGLSIDYLESRAYLRGGFKPPPPPKFSDFFLKSEGKEIERKRKKRDIGGGGVTS